MGHRLASIASTRQSGQLPPSGLRPSQDAVAARGAFEAGNRESGLLAALLKAEMRYPQWVRLFDACVDPSRDGITAMNSVHGREFSV
jgi:hypothetical protein